MIKGGGFRHQGMRNWREVTGKQEGEPWTIRAISGRLARADSSQGYGALVPSWYNRGAKCAPRPQREACHAFGEDRGRAENSSFSSKQPYANVAYLGVGSSDSFSSKSGRAHGCHTSTSVSTPLGSCPTPSHPARALTEKGL